MATLAFGVIGAAIGAAIGTTGATFLGLSYAAWGWTIGTMVGATLFPPKTSDMVGPRLSDLRVQNSGYGQAIARCYGTIRLAGNVIWATPLVESSHETESGGKGGGGGSVTTYSYAANVAVAICEGPRYVRKIWANGTLIYDNSVGNTGTTGRNDNIRIYTGDETQTPDPLIESVQGVGATPAYRGLTYVVFENFQLADYGNVIPNFSFEVVQDATVEELPRVDLGAGNSIAQDTATGYIWANAGTAVNVFDAAAETTVATVPLDLDPEGTTVSAAGITFVEPTNKFWVGSAAIPHGVYDGAVIDAEDYGVQYLEFSSAITWWPAVVAFDFHRQAVIFYGANGLAGGAAAALDMHGAPTPDVDWTYPQMVNAVKNRLDLGDEHQHVVSSNTTLRIIRTAGAYQYYSDFPVGSWTTYTYDPTRRVVWVFQTGPKLLSTIDIDTQEWQDIATLSWLTVSSGNNALIGYDNADDTLWISYRGSDGDHMDEISLSTFEQTRRHISPGTQGGAVPMLYDAGSDAMIFAKSGRVWKYPLGHGLDASPVRLSEVVADLSARVGLSGDDIDVAELTDWVEGYAISRRGTVRTALEPLATAYLFDATESDYAVKYTKRGAAPARTLAADDLAAYESGDPPPVVAGERAHDLDLPARVDVSYLRRASDYQASSQFARRESAPGDQAATLELALVLGDDEARHIAQTLMIEAWLGRQGVKWQTTRKHADLDPGDAVYLPMGNAGAQAVRIVRRDESRNGLIRWEGVAYDASAYTPFGTGFGGPDTAQSGVTAPVGTVGLLLDLPALRDQDDDAGYYWAVAQAAAGSWSGAGLMKSIDSGTTYGQIAATADQTVVGGVLGVLGAGPVHVFDEGNTLTVSLAHGTLSTATREAIYNGANAAVVGSEVLQFRTATLNGDGTYTLSGLLRGRKGTEAAVATHGSGEYFVLLRAGVVRIAGQSAEIGAARLFKSVSAGQLVADVAADSFTATGRALKPYAPVQLAGGRNAAGDLALSWRRRGRLQNEWSDGVDVPLSEASEGYELEIWDAGYATLKRAVSGLSSPSYTYTAADQTTDFGSPQSSVAVRIYQISAAVGRGEPLEDSR